MTQINTRFKPLFLLEVWHEYYGGVCPDIDFTVPQNTAGILRGTGLLAKAVEGTLHVLYRSDEAGPPPVSAAGKTVRIGLVVRDPCFANITEGFDPGAGALRYRNGAAPGALDPPDRLALGPRVEPELWREGAFGVVEIAVDGAFYDAAPSFTVAFEARRETLRYYVVAKGFSNGDVDQLTVRDQGFGEPGRPEEVKFRKVLPAELTAVVQPVDWPTSGELSDELTQFCDDPLPLPQAPIRIRFTEHLPRAATGKLYRNQIELP